MATTSTTLVPLETGKVLLAYVPLLRVVLLIARTPHITVKVLPPRFFITIVWHLAISGISNKYGQAKQIISSK